MNPKNQNEQSIIKTGLLAIFAGVIIGVFYVCYEWSWNNLLSGIVAGIGFTVMFFLTTVVFKLPKDGWHLYFHTVVSGLVGGLAWWAVATTQTSVIIPMMIGGVAAPLTMWLETRGYSKKGSGTTWGQT
jgi:hypothetical protein